MNNKKMGVTRNLKHAGKQKWVTHDTAPLAAASEKYFKEVELAMTLESTLPDKHHDRCICVCVCVYVWWPTRSRMPTRQLSELAGAYGGVSGGTSVEEWWISQVLIDEPA